MTGERYELFGLTFASDFVIPWAPRSAGGGVDDVRIRRASPNYCGPAGHEAKVLDFEVPEVGGYWITGGREIVVRPKPGASEEALRLYLLGSALGILLHQRGLLVLHANAIVIDGGVYLFLGPSGAGKSTLAAWFASRGFTVLTDDVCAVQVSADGRFAVLPGLARLRLTQEAAGHFGMETSEESLSPSSGKHEIGLSQASAPASQALRGCYLLSEDTGDGALSVQSLANLDAVQMLMANTYRGFALQQLGGSSDHMAACLRVAARVPCFEARRGKEWARFDATAEGLLAHARTAAPPASLPQTDALGAVA